jgi:lipopolysaccharide/colanic/teichoic acid biosynthesis glycosyltransferase
MSMIHTRWKIENETFNTLKNQGYHFEHNYGHGILNLATVLALLMLLAFTIDQMRQHGWQLFGQARAGLRTKAKLWESLRSLFKVLLFRTMTALYRHMAYQYDIQLK